MAFKKVPRCLFFSLIETFSRSIAFEWYYVVDIFLVHFIYFIWRCVFYYELGYLLSDASGAVRIREATIP